MSRIDVSKKDAAAICLSLLDELKMRPQGRFLPSTIVQKWDEVGLRDSDLEMALDYLVSTGMVEVTTFRANILGYALTDAGHQQMHKLNSLMSLGMRRYQRLWRKAVKRLQSREAFMPVIHDDRRVNAYQF